MRTEDAALQAKLDALKKSAEQCKQEPVKVTLVSGGHSSLNDVINTQEKADLFMKLLRSM